MLSKSWLAGGFILVVSISVTSPIQAESLAPKTLNNLVNELVNFNFSTSPQEDYLTKPYRVFSFERLTDGWIYISIDVEVNKADRVWITLADNLSEKPILEVDSVTRTDKAPETMRFVEAGSYKIRLWSKGTPKLNNIIVRSIPEIIFFKMFFRAEKYSNYAKRMGYYKMRGWDYMKKQEVWNNYNVVVSVGEIDEYEPYINEWRKKGGRWFRKGSVGGTKTTGTRGPYQWEEVLSNPLVDGIIIDEFGSGAKHREQYRFWADCIIKLGKNPKCKDKTFYGFTGAYNPAYKPLLNPIFESGFAIAPERYLAEQEDENKADRFLKKYFVRDMENWLKYFPASEKNLVCFLAPDDIIPVISWNKFPHVDFKVYLDKQFNLIANYPAFRNLYGVGFWTASFTSEETLNWHTRLVRHYLIEGNRDMLSKDPYILTHLDNPGFEREQGWNFAPASYGAIKIIDVKQLQFKKRNKYPAIPDGTKVLYTKRVKKKPNFISQEIKDLTPNRLYSLKVYNADFEDFETKKRISTSIHLRGVELLQEKSRDEVLLYPAVNNREGKSVNICWNSHYRVFRAKSNSGELILTDWKSDVAAGGPENQEIIWDFIELQPYFEVEN